MSARVVECSSEGWRGRREGERQTIRNLDHMAVDGWCLFMQEWYSLLSC